MINKNVKYFENREDAAEKLRDVLPHDKMKSEKWELIAISSGGLDLASHLLNRYKLPLGFLLTAPIKAPNNSECEIARVSESEEIVIDESLVRAFEIQYDYIYGEATRQHEEKILSDIYKYRHGAPFKNMENKTVLLIDEGSENGLKLMCAIKTILTMNPSAVYVAVPVLPKDVLEVLEPLVDSVFYIQEVGDFVTTSHYYKNLEKIDTTKITKILGDIDEL
ncbi:MAG: phosphoribosyltransferase [Helicobacteraceae bacterium]|nr:phosphoribosyltransferase [Helicobacteraceae bacterium]